MLNLSRLNVVTFLLVKDTMYISKMFKERSGSREFQHKNLVTNNSQEVAFKKIVRPLYQVTYIQKKYNHAQTGTVQDKNVTHYPPSP